MPVAVAVCTAGALVVVPVLVLATWARLRFTRRLASFRCRLGRPVPGRPRTRWRFLPTRAAWAGDVLLVRSGPFHLDVTPVPVGVPRQGNVRYLEARDGRCLGGRPVALTVTTDAGDSLEIAAAGSAADLLVGPFLTALLPALPPAPRDRGA
jgi:hypothetical protein